MSSVKYGRTALLIVDVQNQLVDSLAAYRADELCSNINALLEKARSSGVPVIYVQHSDEELVAGTHGWQIAESVRPIDGEPIVHKRFCDAFRETNLAATLEEAGADSIAVCGMQTELCVDSTVREAKRRGYGVTLVSAAHATFDTCDASGVAIVAEVERALRGIASIRPVSDALGPAQ